MFTARESLLAVVAFALLNANLTAEPIGDQLVVANSSAVSHSAYDYDMLYAEFEQLPSTPVRTIRSKTTSLLPATSLSYSSN